MPINEGRKFLHDLATPLTIIKLQVRKLEKLLDVSTNAKESPQQNAALKEIISALTKIENLHAEYKNTLFERSNK